MADMHREATYIVFGDEVAKLLADNETDLVALLAKEGLRVTSTHVTVTTDAASRPKDLVVVLLASVALVGLTPIITRAVNRLTTRTVLVKEVALVPVEDSSGKVVKTSAGEPILYWTETSRLLNAPTKGTSEASMVQLRGLGLEITLSTSADD